MARINFTGFETGDTSELGSVSGGSVQSTISRSGTYAFRANPSNGQVTATYNYSNADIASVQFHRVYVRVDQAPNADCYIASIRSSGGTDRFRIRLKTDLRIIVVNEGGSEVGPHSQLTQGVFHRLEFHIDFTTASTIAFELLQDGLQITNTTASVAVNSASLLVWGAFGTNVTCDIYFDDIASNDNSGSHQRGYCGEGKIVHLHPNAESSGSRGTQGTDWDTGPSTGGQAFQQVDEIVPNGATDYLELIVNSSGPTNRVHDFPLDSSASKGIPSNAIIPCVAGGISLRGETGSGVTAALRMKSQDGGTTIEEACGVATTTFVTHDDAATTRQPRLINYTDPQAGGLWTTALLDTAQIGVRATDAAPDIWISALWMMVEYVEQSADAPDIVQTTSKQSSATTGDTISLTGVTAGNTLILLILHAATNAASFTSTFDGGVTPNLAASEENGNRRVEIHYLENALSGTNTATISASIATTWESVLIEIDGVFDIADSFDEIAASISTRNFHYTSPTGILTPADSLILSASVGQAAFAGLPLGGYIELYEGTQVFVIYRRISTAEWHRAHHCHGSTATRTIGAIASFIEPAAPASSPPRTNFIRPQFFRRRKVA